MYVELGYPIYAGMPVYPGLPQVELTHYESKSRGYETTPEKAERFEREKALLKERWPMYMEQGDPYYNPNLTLTAPDCSIDYERDGWR